MPHPLRYGNFQRNQFIINLTFLYISLYYYTDIRGVMPLKDKSILLRMSEKLKKETEIHVYEIFAKSGLC